MQPVKRTQSEAGIDTHLDVENPKKRPCASPSITNLDNIIDKWFKGSINNFGTTASIELYSLTDRETIDLRNALETGDILKLRTRCSAYAATFQKNNSNFLRLARWISGRTLSIHNDCLTQAGAYRPFHEFINELSKVVLQPGVIANPCKSNVDDPEPDLVDFENFFHIDELARKINKLSTCSIPTIADIESSIYDNLDIQTLKHMRTMARLNKGRIGLYFSKQLSLGGIKQSDLKLPLISESHARDLAIFLGQSGTDLEKLTIFNLSDLKYLRPDSLFPNIKHLSIATPTIMRISETRKGILALQSQELNLSYFHLKFLFDKKNLTSIDIGHCVISSIKPIKNATSLRSLSLYNCEFPQIDDVNASLENLSIRDCGLVNIAQIKNFSSLTKLRLTERELTDITPFENLTSLTHLDLHRCINLKNMTPLSNLTSLKYLSLFLCNFVEDITPIGMLCSLTDLNLNCCISVNDINPLASLSSLTNLNLARCHRIPNIDPLANLYSLTDLNLSYCDTILDVNPVSELYSLTSINLGYCQNLNNIDGLKPLSNLATLNIDSCQKIQEIKVVKFLTSLKSLSILGFKNRKELYWGNVYGENYIDLNPIKDLPNLKYVFSKDEEFDFLTKRFP